MRKIITLMAVFLLVAGMGTAAKGKIDIMTKNGEAGIVAGGEKTENGEDVDIVKEKTKLAGDGPDEKERGITINTKVVELAHSDRNGIGDAVSGLAAKKDGKVKEVFPPGMAGGGDDAFQEALAGLVEAAHSDEDGERRAKKIVRFKPGAELSNKVK